MARDITLIGVIRLQFTVDLPPDDQAISFYTREIQSHPDSAYFHLRLGYAYRANRRFQEALEAFGKAVVLEPQFAFAHFQLADQFFLMNSYEKAISEYKEAIRLKPDFVEAYFALAAVDVRLRNYEEAISICRKAASIRPDLDVLQVAYGRIGMISKFMERKEERIEALRQYAAVEKQILEINPDASVGPQTWLNQAGDLCQELGRNDEALQAYKESISLDHDYQEKYYAYLQLAALCKRLGRDDEAERYCDQIAGMTKKLVNETKNPIAKGDGYYRLGIISEMRGREKEALQLYVKSTEMRPNYAKTHRALARLYSKGGNGELADKENSIARKLEEEGERKLDLVRNLGKPNEQVRKPD